MWSACSASWSGWGWRFHGSSSTVSPRRWRADNTPAETVAARAGMRRLRPSPRQRARREATEFTMSQVSEPELREELRSASVEPLLPIEKKLIGWSLAIGLVLLAVLAAANYLL